MSETLQRKTFDDKPNGLMRADDQGLELIDAVAGRACIFGLGFNGVVDAIQSAAQNYWGDASGVGERIQSDPDQFAETVIEVFSDCKHLSVDSIHLAESADLAVETAIRFARALKPDSYRTVALIGSDHGRTAACRTASGRPELHQDFGPMLPGFAHIPANDIEALKATIDDQVACLLISPLDLHSAGRGLDENYLNAAREICDQHDVAIVVDESRIPFGGAGKLLSVATLAPITVDGAIFSAGLFGGVAGGLFVGAKRFTKQSVLDTKWLPIQNEIAHATFTELANHDLATLAEDSQEIAVAIAEAIGGFEFVRDVHAHGATLGIEMDIESADVVVAAAANGLRIESAGETAIRMLLPIIVSDSDRAELVDRLAKSLAQIEQQATESLQS